MSSSNTTPPPLFSKLGKSLSDLFKKKYDFKNQVTLKTKTADGLALDTTAQAKGKGEFAGKIKWVYKHNKYGEFEEVLQTDGSVDVKAKLTKIAEGAELTLKADQDLGLNVELDYKKDFLAAEVNIDMGADTTLVQAAAVVGVNGLAVGGQVEYDTVAQDWTNYNAAFEYSAKDFTATIKTSDKVEKMNFSYIHKVTSDATVGAAMAYNINDQDKPTVLTVGGSYEIDADTHFRSKLSTDGKLSAVLEQQLQNPALKVAFSSEWDYTTSGSAAEKFGIGFTLGE